MPQLAQGVCSYGGSTSWGLCSVSFHAVHWLSMSRPTILVSMRPFATMSAVTNESHYFLFLGPFSLSLQPLLLPLLLPTFALSRACHGVNVHWRCSRMIWSLLPGDSPHPLESHLLAIETAQSSRPQQHRAPRQPRDRDTVRDLLGEVRHVPSPNLEPEKGLKPGPEVWHLHCELLGDRLSCRTCVPPPPGPSGILNGTLCPSHVTSSECSGGVAPSSTPRRMASFKPSAISPRAASIPIASAKTVHWIVQRRLTPPSRSTITRDTSVRKDSWWTSLSGVTITPLALILASGGPRASFRATPCRLRTIVRHGYPDVDASKTPLPPRMACTGNRGLKVGSVFSEPRPPLRKPPITSRTVQAKRTRKSSTQQCQSDREHFCSGQVRLQVASCVSQCPRSSRWASSS